MSMLLFASAFALNLPLSSLVPSIFAFAAKLSARLTPRLTARVTIQLTTHFIARLTNSHEKHRYLRNHPVHLAVCAAVDVVPSCLDLSHANSAASAFLVIILAPSSLCCAPYPPRNIPSSHKSPIWRRHPTRHKSTPRTWPNLVKAA